MTEDQLTELLEKLDELKSSMILGGTSSTLDYIQADVEDIKKTLSEIKDYLARGDQ